MPRSFGDDQEIVDDNFDPNATQFGNLDDFEEENQNGNLPPELFADEQQAVEYDEDGTPLLPVRGRQNDEFNPVAPNRNQRGPRPALMGAGNMRPNDIESLVNNFWADNQEQNGGSARQSPQEQFFSGLLDKLENIGQGGQQQNVRDTGEQSDREWDNFLKDRRLVPGMDELTQLFNEAGNDPVKNQQVMHQLLSQTAKNTYRQVAQDMQPMLTQLMQRMIPAYLQQHHQQVSSEQQFNGTLQQFYARNPHMQRQALSPVVQQVMQQALARTNGNATAAIRLAEAFMQKNMPSSPANQGRNNFRNNAGGNTVNWSQVARGPRG
jgi:hypothetical protein